MVDRAGGAAFRRAANPMRFRESRRVPRRRSLVFQQQSGELVGWIADLSHNGLCIRGRLPAVLGASERFQLLLQPEGAAVQEVVVQCRCTWIETDLPDGRSESGWDILGHGDPQGERQLVAFLLRHCRRMSRGEQDAA
jgi:hypothetical protein